MDETISKQPEEVQRLGLRERKKRLIQATIEDTALQLFRERGYEETSIQDIADAVMMSPRTFFRYFSSKEEVLFAPMQTVFSDAVAFLQHYPPAEPLTAALSATFAYMASIYKQERARLLVRYQVSRETPALASVYLYSIATMEPMLCKALAECRETHLSERQIKLLVAIVMATFRVIAQEWLEDESNSDFVTLVHEHLDPLLKTLIDQWKTAG
jgi:AcrR family transcriptional regulator